MVVGVGPDLRMAADSRHSRDGYEGGIQDVCVLLHKRVHGLILGYS